MVTITAIVLWACGPKPAACTPDPSRRAFEATKIGEQWIDYVWIEFPTDIALSGESEANVVEGRLFVASADPVGAIVPTMIELPCAASPVDYAPAEVTFDVDGQGVLKTSYAWGSCSSCSDCYMRWTFSLDLTGRVQDGALVADLALNETFHTGPMNVASVRMEDVTAACSEPRLTCQPDGKCGAIRHEGRAE